MIDRSLEYYQSFDDAGKLLYVKKLLEQKRKDFDIFQPELKALSEKVLDQECEIMHLNAVISVIDRKKEAE